MVRTAAGHAKTGPRHVRRHVTVSAAITAPGGLLFGYGTGVVSGALLFVKKDFGGLSSFQRKPGPSYHPAPARSCSHWLMAGQAGFQPGIS